MIYCGLKWEYNLAVSNAGEIGSSLKSVFQFANLSILNLLVYRKLLVIIRSVKLFIY